MVLNDLVKRKITIIDSMMVQVKQRTQLIRCRKAVTIIMYILRHI